ncbi:MAG: hypothetical protein AAF191_21540, partial [Verrucomicrobiota bacterium]
RCSRFSARNTSTPCSSPFEDLSIWKNRRVQRPYRPGVILTENPETGSFEAGILLITSPRDDGTSLVSIRYGTPSDLRNSVGKIVDSSNVQMRFHASTVSGRYNEDMTVGTLGGYDFVVSLDSEPFDYRGLHRTPKVAHLTPP